LIGNIILLARLSLDLSLG